MKKHNVQYGKSIIGLLMAVLIIISGVPVPTFGASESVIVGSETYMFDTGSGAHGVVIVRVKDGNISGNKIEVLKNGTVVSTYVATPVPFKESMITYGAADVTALSIPMEAIAAAVGAPYSPVYSVASMNAPTLSGVPEFASFEVGAGVQLTTTGNVALAYKTKSQLVSGYIQSKYGAAGGGNAQNTIIFASESIISETGRMFAYGGGGGDSKGGYPNAGGNGGNGGNEYLYSGTTILNGIIQAGHSGGGGSSAMNFGGGVSGTPGDVILVTNALTGNGKALSGTKGPNGGSSQYESTSHTITSAFGSGLVNAQTTSNVYPFTGGPGNYSTSTQMVSCNWVAPGNYTSYMGTYPSYSWEGVPFAYSSYPTGKVTLRAGQKDSTITIGLGSNNSLSSAVGLYDIKLAGTPGTLNMSNVYGAKNTGYSLSLDGQWNLTAGTQTALAVSTLNVNGGITVDNSVTLSGPITQMGPNNEVVFSGASSLGSAVTINSQGNVRFTNNASALTTGYWSGKTVTVNGLRVLRVQPSVGTNDFGIITVNLDEWTTNYKSGVNGALATQMMEFCIEKKTASNPTWTKVAEVSRSIANPASWKDMSTVVGELTTYRVGYRNPGQTGYVFVENCEIGGKSEGGGGLDETAPTISYFQVAGGATEVKSSMALVELVATDNRTQQNVLKMRVDVNDTDFVPASGSWKAASLDQKGDYSAVTTNLPLQEGNNRVTAEVFDEAGNKTIQIKYVKYIPDGSMLTPQISPDLLAPGAASAITLTNTMNTALKSTIMDGENVWVADSNIITGVFKPEDLPADIVSFNYAISGDQYSKQLAIAKPFKMQLPPVAGMYLVKLSFTNNAGNSSQEPITMNILYDKAAPTISVKSTTGATVTKSSSTPYLLDIVDDASKTFTWSIDGNAWNPVPVDYLISVPLSSGYNNKPIYVKDTAGRVGSAWIKIFKMN